MQNQVSNKTIDKLKYDLVRNNFLSYEELARAEEIASGEELSLSQVLVKEGYIEEESLLRFIQDNLNIPYVNLEDYSLDEKCLSFISSEDARTYRMLPLFRIENVLTVAMADPLDLFTLNNIVKCVKCDIEPVVCSENLIYQFIERYYTPETLNIVGEKDIKEGIRLDWREELNDELPDTAQVEKITGSIISQALLEGVFEIIFEHNEEGLNVKFREAGKMLLTGTIPLLLSPLCVSHIKRLSGLDPSVSDVPQSGKFRYAADVEYITGVVSTFPTTQGERIVIKLYKPPKTVSELKTSDENKNQILRNLEKPGIILISGQELSGKSFLAYTMLNSMDSANKNIMTIESIVKYDLKGINQSELNEKVGFNSEKALKLIDFQSPDVVYIEEISSDDLLAFAGPDKLVIAEVNEDNISERLKEAVNCLILLDSSGEMSILSYK